MKAANLDQLVAPISFDPESVSRKHIEQIISHLEIVVFKPEEEIVKQYDQSHDMYFIQYGTAYVKYRDRLGREKLLGRKLEVGYHFGHIALFYNTRRSATVVSGDFSTMGRLSKQGYETLVEKMPEFAAVMEKIC